jgi:hypothetical protein
MTTGQRHEREKSPESDAGASAVASSEAHAITNWPGKYTEARFLGICILMTLAICLSLQWFAANKNAAAEATGLVGFIYLLTMILGLVGRGIFHSKLRKTLGLLTEDLPDLEAYAQAASNVNSPLAASQFRWYARWHWCVGLSITGFVTVGLFQLLAV